MIKHTLHRRCPTFAQLIARPFQDRLNWRVDRGGTEERADLAIHFARGQGKETIAAAMDQRAARLEEYAVLSRDKHAASFGRANIARPRAGR